MGKHCDRMVHVTACMATFFAALSCIAYFVIQGMRDKILLNLEEYREVRHDWETVPYTEVAIGRADRACPVTHPSLVIYDSWPGLEVSCYCIPGADYDSVVGAPCEGARSGSTKCTTREAVPTLNLGVLNGYKICGKRGGEPFKTAKRLVVGSDGFLKCPDNTIACDDTVLPATAQDVESDPDHPANFMICAESEDTCPITYFEVGYNDNSETLIVRTKKRASNLPLLRLKLAHDSPCLKPSYYQDDAANYFDDEIRKLMTGCKKSDYFDYLVDPRYTRVPGNYEVS